MKQKLISICIPTFNRSLFLKKNLLLLTKAIAKSGAKSEIEIIISDNKSVDDTSKIARGFAKKYSYIRYFVNKTNLGFTLNYLNAVKHAKAKYIWSISDDDFVYVDSLRKLLLALKKYNPSLIYLNYNARILDKKKALKNILKLKGDEFFPTRRIFFDFFNNLMAIYQLRSSYFSFISMSVIRKDLLKKNIQKLRHKVNVKSELFPHTWFFWGDFPKKRILLLSAPFFEQSFSLKSHSTMATSWLHSCINFIQYMNPIYVYILKHYKKEASAVFKIIILGGIVYSYLTLFLAFFFFLASTVANLLNKTKRGISSTPET